MKKFINLDFEKNFDITNQIDLIKQNNFDGVIIFYDHNFITNIERVIEADLAVDSVHLPFTNIANTIWQEANGDDNIDLLCGYIKIIANYPVKNVVFHISSGDNPPAFNALGLKRIEKLLNCCRKYQLNLCLENLRKIEYLDYVYDNINSQNLKICFDSGHANVFLAGIDNFNYLKYQDEIVCVHLHDNDGTSDQHLLPFQGNIDWHKLMKNLAKVDLNLTLEVYNHLADTTAFLNRANLVLNDLEKIIIKLKAGSSND